MTAFNPRAWIAAADAADLRPAVVVQKDGSCGLSMRIPEDRPDLDVLAGRERVRAVCEALRRPGRVIDARAVR